MKAAFALLANTEVHNLVRKLAWDIHEKYHTGTIDSRLPPHISLKQPFVISNLDLLEEYMDELAKSITPFEVNITEIQIRSIPFEGIEFGLLWIDVQEADDLRQLHDRLNKELSQRFGNTRADFDGAAYHFHLTVMIGGQPVDMYRKFYNGLSETKVNLQFTVSELAMFVYDEPMRPQGEYLTYKILPIGR
jgi:2'-5' RNA ligase